MHARESLVDHHVVVRLKSEDVQHLKGRLSTKAAKTVNNILTVLNVLLKKAVEWDVIDRMPCAITLLPVPKTSMSFYDFDEYERLVDGDEQSVDATAHLIVLLGGEAGLRCGEMIALEWGDVDLAKRQLCVQRSDWNGQVTTPKGGRLRYVPLTIRLAAAFRDHRHLRSQRAVPGRRPAADPADGAVPRAARGAASEAVAGRRAHPASHVLFAPGDARAPPRAIQELAGHRELGMTQRYMHLSPAALDSAIRLLDQPLAVTEFGETFWRRGGSPKERSMARTT